MAYNGGVCWELFRLCLRWMRGRGRQTNKKKVYQMDIYVGNLAYATTDDELRTQFSAFGTVASARVCVDRMTGRSKGFGFVEMPNKEEAAAAIAAMNGKDIDGRALRVNESQPKPREERRGGFGGGRDRDRRDRG